MAFPEARLAMAALIFIGALAAHASAINVEVHPDAGSLTNIKNVSCGSAYSGELSRISVGNSGSGGVLCWYYTNEDSFRLKLTGECVRRGENESFEARIPMPASGQKGLDVQLECFEFFDGTFDTCSDEITYDFAVSHSHSCANADGGGCAGRFIAPRSYNLSCAQLNFSLTLKNGSITLYTGQRASVQVNLTNGINQSLVCDRNIGIVQPLSSVFVYSIPVEAPASGSGSFVEYGSVTCTWVGGTRLTQTVGVDVTYIEDPCTSDLFAARSAVFEAEAGRISALKKIESAEKAGASGVPRQLLGPAYSFLASARASLDRAQQLCNEKNRTGVPPALENAQAGALLAKRQIALASAAADAALGIQGAANATLDTSGDGGNQAAIPAIPSGNVTTINATAGTAPLPGITQDQFIGLGVLALLVGIIIAALAAMWKG